jgi:sulfite reductase beta subunit-like hemoprotein
VLRVFHKHGDYEHKQRNRLKFLVKAMGWDAWHAAFHQELDDLRANGGARLPFDPENAPVEQPPQGERLPQPSIADITALVASGAVKGQGSCRTFTRPMAARDASDRNGCRRICDRRSRESTAK